MVGHAPDLPQPRVIDIVGGADIVDMAEVNSGQELRAAALPQGNGEWQRSLLQEMEAAREGLERVMEGGK